MNPSSSEPPIARWPAGAWRRVSITMAGGVPREVSDVWWLMSAGHFADFRVLRDGADSDLPYSRTQAFGGTYSYDPATEAMSWHHLVDTMDRDGDVDGLIRPEPGNDRLMYEQGPDFSEIWARMDTDDSPTGSRQTGDLLIVWAGVYVIALDAGTRGAARYHFDGSRCVLLDAIGPAPLTADELTKRLPSTG